MSLLLQNLEKKLEYASVCCSIDFISAYLMLSFLLKKKKKRKDNHRQLNLCIKDGLGKEQGLLLKVVPSEDMKYTQCDCVPLSYRPTSSQHIQLGMKQQDWRSAGG